MMISAKKFTKEMELEIYQKWRDEKEFKFNKESEKEIFSIDTPPPYINSPVHMGHASTYTIMDFIARFRRMIGQEVLFPLGLDQNGLPIEISAEKKFGVNFIKIGREEALNYCRKLLDSTTTESIDSFFRSGISFSNWVEGTEIGDSYQTDSDEYRALTQSTFIDLWNKGLIYEDEKVVNWDYKLQTTVSDSEIIYENRSGFFHDIVFKEKESGEEVIIGTTRPELICTCEMVVFHPDDERYKHLEGRTLITPYFEKEVIVKSHPIAEIDKGTGIVMMCSYGDLNDIRFFIEEGLNGKIAINKDGTMNENAGDLAGLKIIDARKKIVEELTNKNLLKKITPTNEHRTPISERSGCAIEFISMPEFYLKQVEFKDKMREIANEVNIYSEKSRKILLDWIDSVSIDWPISRRRYYATEVPLWHCKNCGEVILAKKGKYVRPWKEKCHLEKCPKCGSKEFLGEERVFDTWFDSSISPLYILGYERHPNFFEKNNICSLRPQGKEIVRTWLYYTLLKDYLLTGKIIFEDIWIHHHIVDANGYKFSKSKGNGVDPHEVLEKFGSGPFRLWCAIEGNLDRTDFRCSFERIGNAGKVLEKLWNVSKFVSMFEINSEEENNVELNEADKWILKEVNEIAKYSKEKFLIYDFHNPIIKLMNFIREDFASNYLELVKRRAYNNDENNKFSDKERNAAVKTLRDVLRKSLEILYPVEPAICYYIYKELFGEEIHKKSWPEFVEFDSEINSRDLIEFNSSVWKAKKDSNKSLKDEVLSATASVSLKKIEKELKLMHAIKEMNFGKEIKINI